MSLLEQICALSGQNQILEFELKNLTEALIHFKGNPKYTELLSKYEFNEKLISPQMVDDLIKLLKEKKVIYNKHTNSIFITMSNEQRIEGYGLEYSKLINDLLIDYRIYNTEKGKQKKYN